MSDPSDPAGFKPSALNEVILPGAVAVASAWVPAAISTSTSARLLSAAGIFTTGAYFRKKYKKAPGSASARRAETSGWPAMLMLGAGLSAILTLLGWEPSGNQQGTPPQ